MTRKHLYTIPAAAVVGMAAIGAASLLADPSTAPAQAQPAPQPPTIVRGNSATNGGWSMAACPAGTQLTGGGFLALSISKNGYGNPVDNETGNTPSNYPPNSWAVRWFRGTVQATAMCTT